jgi:hypothetical protein
MYDVAADASRGTNWNMLGAMREGIHLQEAESEHHDDAAIGLRSSGS